MQLPLAVSGWGFKEEFSTPAIKIEKVEDDGEPMEATVEGNCRILLYSRINVVFGVCSPCRSLFIPGCM